MAWRTTLFLLLLSFSLLTASQEVELQEDRLLFKEDAGECVYSEGRDLPDGWEDDTFLEDGFEDYLFEEEEEARSLKQDDAPIPELPVIESLPDTLVAGCVNALSGDFVESISDLTVPGPVPLCLQRSWTSGEREWYFSHMPKLEIGFSKNGNHVEAGYRDDSGSGYHFKGPIKFGGEDLINTARGLRISSKSFRKGLTNLGSSEISGQTSWKGASIRAIRYKDKRKLILRHGTHIDRHFTRYSSKGTQHAVRCGKFHLVEEVYPSGNRFLYRYNSKDDLTCIVAKNKKHEIQYSATIKEVKQTRSQIWTTAAGSVCYNFGHEKNLSTVTSSQHPSIFYTYDSRGRINEKRLANGRTLLIEYIDHGDHKDKVKRLKLSTGPQGALETTHTFTYYGDEKDGQTTVVDAAGGVTYYLRKDRRLDKICHSSGLTEEFTWNEDGELMKHALFVDRENVLEKSFTYDPSGNLTKTVVSGDLTGDGTRSSHVKTFNALKESWNVPLEEKEGDLTVRFEYYPNTNLLAKRLTFAQDTLVKREFFTYDDNGCVSSEILDDGRAENPDDLTGVTERHIKKITSTKNFPFGLPETVEEFVYDIHKGVLQPVNKVVTRYSLQGKKLEEQHFDSLDNPAYTLFWEYDSFGNVTLDSVVMRSRPRERCT